ncbi:hypothetical protein [Rhodococcus sp. (in: high G+C Gram-positive bacteria)]|uniref:hypothetical protein n=1 Tax=Rhodococcus sp. TaxID=1831 RepID=UPI001A1FFF73|nr:hypothetical protein [Rhodococcus sp. (in: high G+C Gram-positive bacteria)]MBJ7479271.1 hypothetical protein [Rhodococcus sp. (in: high G+C Gram-positive bacteria)]
MTTVHVRANQTTVDWAEGAEFVCERTPFVDNLIKHGGLTELGLALSAADVADLGNEYLDALHVAAAQANVNSSSEERQDAEKALANAQADGAAAQENVDETRADSADTLAELNTELDNEPPKTTRPRRKSS